SWDLPHRLSGRIAFGDRKSVELTLDLLKVVGLVLRAADDGVPVTPAVSRRAFRPRRRVLDEKASAVDIPFAALPQRFTGKLGRQIPTPLSCLLELLERHGGCSPCYDSSGASSSASVRVASFYARPAGFDRSARAGAVRPCR